MIILLFIISVIILTVVFFILMGINLSKKSDKCKGIDCGLHGECENGECKCKDGYTGDKCQTLPVPTQSQIDLAKKTVQSYSKLYNNEPFIFFVNYTKQAVVARLGSGNGIIPCTTNIICKWGNNPGISKIHTLGDEVKKDGFNTGIEQSYEILKPNQGWLVKIPLKNDGSPHFCNGNDNNDGNMSCGASQNLYFAYGLTGKYYFNGIKYDTYQAALYKANQKKFLVFPECKSNTAPNLAVGNQSQLELHLLGDNSSTDLSSVNGVSKPIYAALYNSKDGTDIKCTYMGKNKNNLFCNFDRKNCEFPQVEKITTNGKTSYQIVKDEDGLPYNCLQPGIACNFYKQNPDVLSVWGEDLDSKFTFTDVHNTTWNKDGCVPDSNYCKKDDDGDLTYMGMKLKGGSCDLLNAGDFTLDGNSWVTNYPNSIIPPNAKKDPLWNKYSAPKLCGDTNFGSISDRIRMCKYDSSVDDSCPIRPQGSCLSENGKDSWSSDVVQRFCEKCHSDTCSTYCQSYDDYWGTMSCPLSSDAPPNVVLITY